MLAYKIKIFFKKHLQKGSFLWNVLYWMYRIPWSLQKWFIQATNKPDYASEVIYWENVMPRMWPEVSPPEAWQRIFPKDLERYLAEIAQKKGGQPCLLEVGPGPVSMLAWGAFKGLCEIVAVDPLADYYRAIMAGHGYSYPVKPIKGYGEKLVEQFGRGNFDIVYSSNTLDHVTSPRQSLKEMGEMVKPGGFIVLEGYVNEGTRMRWDGLHKHNLAPEGKAFFCTDQGGHRIDLAAGLGIEAVYARQMKIAERSAGTKWYVRDNNEDWYVVVFQRIDLCSE